MKMTVLIKGIPGEKALCFKKITASLIFKHKLHYKIFFFQHESFRKLPINIQLLKRFK